MCVASYTFGASTAAPAIRLNGKASIAWEPVPRLAENTSNSELEIGDVVDHTVDAVQAACPA